MKKKFILLTAILIALCTSTTSVSAEFEPKDVNAAFEITSRGKNLNTSGIILECNDSYYGINNTFYSVNYNNHNNYVIADGMKIMVTNQELKPGVARNSDIIQYVQKIDKDVYLIVEGTDEFAIKNIYYNVYKTNDIYYQMFNHDISKDWCQDVTITENVVSFSNGTDTIYIYPNEGSLSEKSWKGKVEPTVFKKQLRGIDIPITYPEVEEGAYSPYGVFDYEQLTIDGYIPYSAYDSSCNYIILAKNDQQIFSLFESQNTYHQQTYQVPLKDKEIEPISFETKEYDLSAYNDFAKDVVNSENRFHFWYLTRGDEEVDFQDTVSNGIHKVIASNKDIVFDDNNTYFNFYFKPIVNNTLQNTGVGHFTAPTVKLSAQLVAGDDTDSENVYEIYEPYFGGHGASISLTGFVNKSAGLGYQSWASHYFVTPGDYIYISKEENNSEKLYIYKNIYRSESYGGRGTFTYQFDESFYPKLKKSYIYDEYKEFDDAKTFVDYIRKKFMYSNIVTVGNHGWEYTNKLGNDVINSLSCSAWGTNGLSQYYMLTSIVEK